MTLNILMIEGEPAAGRAEHEREFGANYGRSYAAALRALAPDASVDFATPTETNAALPDGAALEGYDAVVLTGSSLHAYDETPAVARQIALAKAVYASRTPFLGSCWGLQVATVAAGGQVMRNPRGREAGFARDVAPTEEGRLHPLLAGRAATYDAPAMHLDVVVLPHDATALAANALAPVQAAEIRYAGGTFWGVQYHPEFSLREIALILARVKATLVTEGAFADIEAADAYCRTLVALDAAPERADLAAAVGLSPEVVAFSQRTVELANFLDRRVRPTKSARGRA